MRTKLLDLMKEAAFMFPENDHRTNKELARALCKSHKKVFERVMEEVEEAVEKNKNYAIISTRELDDIVRGCVEYSEAWHWAITNTREYTIKNMQRFGYEVEIKDILYATESSYLTLQWERGKHSDNSRKG